MRKRFKSTSIAIFGLLIIGTLSFSFTTGSERLITRKHIKVMSYNIHYGIGMDKKYDLERIAKVITAQDPDIVGLQEIGDSIMAATLGKLTGMYSSMLCIHLVLLFCIGVSSFFHDSVLTKIRRSHFEFA